MTKLKLLFCVGFIAIAASVIAQADWRMQNDLEYHYQRIDYWRARMNNDSVVYEDSILRAKLLYYTSANPGTLKDNFKYLKYYDHLTVLNSDDNTFRIYGWDDGSGEHHNFINVFQYKDGDKVESAPIIPGADAGVLKSREYKNMYTLKTKGRVYYLVTFITPRNKEDYSMGIEIFSKNAQGGLDDSTNIIVNNSYGTAVNELEFEMANASGATNHSIYFNKRNRLLYVPIMWKDGVVSTAYTQYRFKNNYFTEVKK
ncbi:MAG TPA: hypothetical protein VK890_10565 [Bacteroidia bacterium]|jgi:hypothetical protein|nr:hypothetical protein [Bacteroidia bacterium]